MKARTLLALWGLAVSACEPAPPGPCVDAVFDADSWDGLNKFSCHHPEQRLAIASERFIKCVCDRDGGP